MSLTRKQASTGPITGFKDLDGEPCRLEFDRTSDAGQASPQDSDRRTA